MFAGVPQVPRKTFWRLRESRKSLEKLFGVCGSPASLLGNFLAFAGVPQVSRETFWRLRDSRKSLGKLFGVCGSPANTSANAAVLARPAQTSRQMRRYLRSLRKRGGVGGMLLCPYTMFLLDIRCAITSKWSLMYKYIK